MSKRRVQQIPHGEIIDIAGAEAPWLTMVHAAAQDHRVFSAQVPAFREDYRLFLIDLPGHGDSASLPGPYGFEEYAASVLAAMDEAGVEITHFMGTHTGAGAGLILACRHLERFRSLILEAPVIPGALVRSAVGGLERARTIARERGIEAAIANWFEREPWYDVVRAHPDRCRAAEHQAILSEYPGRPWVDTAPAAPVESLSERLPSITCPVLVINGEHDVADFVEVADELERVLPLVDRARIPDAGAFPLWEFPDRVNPVVRRFLEQQG